MSPAGNFESLKAAICGGANAVYIGLARFSARQNADNFNYENFAEAVLYCHLHDVKLYVAINTIIKEDELDDCISDVNFVISNHADAIIIQDVNLAQLIHKTVPNFPIHLSTQCGICTLEGAIFAKSIGASRIVLARETTLSEIERIHKNIDIEIEFFVQGALCVSFSGNCYLSSICGGNSGNRGRCAQPCRKKMQLYCDEQVVDGYNLSPKDLFLYKDFQKLIRAGVYSFKIEGRMRTPEYVHFSTLLYRKAANGEIATQEDFDNLKAAFNRGDFSNGYLFGRKSMVIYNQIQNNIGVEIGKIVKVKNKSNEFKAFVETSYIPTRGDGFKITRNNLEIGGGVFLHFCDVSSNGFEIATKFCKTGDVVRLTNSAKNQKSVKELSDKIPISIQYKVKFDGISLIISTKTENDGVVSVEYFADFLPQRAKTVSISKPELENQLNRLNETHFSCVEIFGELDDGIFIAKSQLNSVRRNAVEEFILKIQENINDKFPKNFEKIEYSKQNSIEMVARKKCVILNEENCSFDDFNDFDILIFKPFVYSIENVKKFEILPQGEKYLYLPNYITESDIKIIELLLENSNFTGIYSDGYNGIEIAKRHNLNLFLGTNCNITNSLIDNLDGIKQKYYALSKELNNTELEKLSSNAFVLTFGGFPVMTFVHCPILNANLGNCNDCKFRNVKYVDEENREFEVSKTKIDGCLFTMLNTVTIDIGKQLSQNSLFDLSFYDQGTTKKLLVGSKAKGKGHYSRGVK